MKNLFNSVKDIILLMVLCLFPFCISILFEYVLVNDTKITTSFLLIPLLLIGSMISYCYFSTKEGIKLTFNSNICLLAVFFVFGLTLKSTIVIIALTVSNGRITSDNSLNLYNMFMAVLITPVAEELIFRVILQRIINNLMKKEQSTLITITLTSLIWSAVHLYGISFESVLLMFDGIILSFAYKKHGSFLIIVFYHMGINLSMYMIPMFYSIKYVYIILNILLIFISMQKYISIMKKERLNKK